MFIFNHHNIYLQTLPWSQRGPCSSQWNLYNWEKGRARCQRLKYFKWIIKRLVIILYLRERWDLCYCGSVTSPLNNWSLVFDPIPGPLLMGFHRARGEAAPVLLKHFLLIVIGSIGLWELLGNGTRVLKVELWEFIFKLISKNRFSFVPFQASGGEFCKFAVLVPVFRGLTNMLSISKTG